MKRLLLGACLSFSLLSPAYSSAKSVKLIEVGKGYSKTSVNTTIFRNSSLTTFKNNQYIAYYDEDSYLVVGKRKIGDDKWEIKRSQYKGNCKDAHNVISIMADGKGYIHLSFDHHGHPLRYCKSVEPGSLDLSEMMPMTGDDEGHVTYPEFYRLADGSLLFAYRSGGSGRGNLVMNRFDISTSKWERVQDKLVDGEGQRNAYWQLYVDGKGTIHISWVWRETPDVATNHDLCYAKSEDGGKTWKKSNGDVYQLPITATNAEYVWHIPQNSELINQTSMTADKNGNPYIATYWRDQSCTIPQYRLVWFDGKEWHQDQVSQRTQPFSLSGGGTKMIPIARPRLVVKPKGKKLQAYYIFRDAERDSKVSMYYTSDIKKGVWNVKDITDFSVDAWEPSLDSDLWNSKSKLNIFVQKSSQGDGERTTDLESQMVYVAEVEL